MPWQSGVSPTGGEKHITGLKLMELSFQGAPKNGSTNSTFVGHRVSHQTHGLHVFKLIFTWCFMLFFDVYWWSLRSVWGLIKQISVSTSLSNTEFHNSAGFFEMLTLPEGYKMYKCSHFFATLSLTRNQPETITCGGFMFVRLPWLHLGCPASGAHCNIGPV